MDDDKIVQFIQQEKAESDYDGTSTLSYQREQSTRAYSGVDFPDGLQPTTGMSSVVINKVQPAVETLTTYVAKPYVSDKEPVVFTPTNGALGPVADQTSMLANYVIHKANPGYNIISRWIKDAAINKNSIVKWMWDTTTTSFTETYENISEVELNVILQQKEELGYEVDIMESESKTEMVLVANPQTGEQIEVEQTSSKYVIRCTHAKGLPKIENVPPEEFLINNDATSLSRDDNLTRFVCHRKLMYVGDVIAMFPDVDMSEITSGSGSDYLEFDYEAQNRGSFDGTYSIRGSDRGEGALKQVELTESWVKIDVKGDNTLDWYHCFTVGNTMLSKEVWDGPIPFASFCFFPIPHKFYGLSIYDKIGDAFRTITALTRGEVDMTNQRNTFRLIADPRFIDQRDLQSGRPGIIKARAGFDPNSVMALPTPSGSGGNVAPMLAYLDQYIHSQLGIDPLTGAISTDVEKSGNDAAKTSQVVDNASAKVETYSREFSEAMRQLIWGVTWMLIEHKDEPSVMKLVNELTPNAPFLLGQEGMENALSMADLTAKVGLGHLTQQQKLVGVQSIMAEQSRLEQTGVLLPPAKKLAVSMELCKAVGYENTQDFFPSPEEVQGMQQQMQAMIQQAQQEGIQIGMQQAAQQVEQQKTLAEVQKIAADIQLINAKAQGELTDADVARRETLIKEREQMLEEILSQNPNATHSVTTLI